MTTTHEIALYDILADLDRSGPVPLYWQIAERLEAAIASGTLAPGARVENEVSLSARLGLSQMTVKRAMGRLVTRGLVVRRRGFGTVVVPQGESRRLALTSLFDDLTRDGHVPSTAILDRERVVAEAVVAARLAIPLGTAVLRIRRLRFSDGAPIALLQNTLAPRFADVSEGELRRTGLYRLIRSRGTHISVATQVIGARTATPYESMLLGLDLDDAVLTMRRTAFDAAGEPIEFGDHCYRTDAHSFDVTVVLP